MRYRVKDYTVSPSGSSVWLYFTAPQGVELSSDPDNEIEPFIAQAIRLVVDESAGVVYCSSMQKRAYLERAKCNLTTRQIRLCFGVPSGKFVSETNAFTIEMDWGDEPSGLSGSDDAHNLAAFFNITPPVPNAVPMTQQEVEDDLDELWNLIITQ